MRALVVAIDDAYVMPFKVMLHSLIKSNSLPKNSPIYVMHEDTLSLASIIDIQEFVSGQGRSANFLKSSKGITVDLPLNAGDHVSYATYFRLFAASILPLDVETAVYLDADLIILRCARELFEMPLIAPIAAVDHMAPAEQLRLWGDAGGTYFQAGVVIMNLKLWRKMEFEKQFKEVLQYQRNRIRWWDQDVLNLVFKDNWQRLDIWLNLERTNMKSIDTEYAKLYAKIVHFDGSLKPWKIENAHELSDLWYKAYECCFGHPFDRSLIKRPKPKPSRRLAISVHVLLKRILPSLFG